MPRAFRFAIILLAIASVLGVSVAAASPAHFHAKPPANGCDICFTVHVTASEAKSLALVLRAPELRWRVPDCAEAAGYKLVGGGAFLTRGPPSLS